MEPDFYALVESDAACTVAAESFWTAERIESVEPIPLPSIVRPRRPQHLRGGYRLDPGTNLRRPIHAEPIPPKPAAVVAATTTRVADLTKLPFAVVGKLRMAFPGGGVYQGSAWVIGKRAILTAGHCVYDARNGGWATDIQFLPQYAGGATLGTWSVTRKTTLREFVNAGDLDFDLAACILDRDIGDRTGIAGWRVNEPIERGAVTAVGYPASPTARFPFDGERMWQSVGTVVRDERPGTTDDRTYGMANDLTGGCSGGPWFAAGPEPVAVGLNSHIITDEPGTLYSPYFGRAFLRLLEWIKTNGGEPGEPGDNPAPDLKLGLTRIVGELNALIGTLN